MQPQKTIIIQPKTVSFILLLIIVGLVLANITGQVLQHEFGYNSSIIRGLDFDNERNIPAFFSTVLLLISASLLGSIAAVKRKEQDSYTRHWAMLSLIFVFLALDENVSLHERLIEPLRNALHTGGVFYYAWVIPAIFAVLCFAILYFKFLFHLPKKSRLIFSIAAILYIGGAIGVEMIGGRHADLYGVSNFSYSMITTLEESFEMAGILLFIFGLLCYVESAFREIYIAVGKQH